MLKYIALFIFFTTVASASNEDCNFPESCFENTKDTFKFPDTKAELDETCKYLYRYYKCVLLAETCKPLEFDAEDIEIANSMVKAIKDLCREDNPIYADVLNNLQCLKSLADKYGICSFNISEEMLMPKLYKALVEEGVTAFSQVNSSAQTCLQGMQQLACEVLRIEERCGTNVMHSITEIIRKTSIMFIQGCSEEVKEYLSDVIRIVKKELSLNHEPVKAFTRKP